MQRRTVQTQSTQSGREHRLEKAAGQGSRSPLRASGSTNQRQASTAHVGIGLARAVVWCGRHAHSSLSTWLSGSSEQLATEMPPVHVPVLIHLPVLGRLHALSGGGEGFGLRATRTETHARQVSPVGLRDMRGARRKVWAALAIGRRQRRRSR